MRRPREALLMRILLDAVYHLATPFLLLGLLVPSRRFTLRRWRGGLLQRLGGVPPRQGDRTCLWLHAVSVGELRAALPLLEGLRERFPGWELWVSTSTDAAQEAALRILPRGVTVFLWPLDYGWAVRRTLARVRPSAVILLELELWPNFLLAAEERGVPVLVVNGRISARSFPQYKRVRRLSRGLFRRVKAFAVQNQEYADRFRFLGAPPERVEVLGNLKYDGVPAPGVEGSTSSLLGWDAHGPVLTAGCTHPGEEEALVRAWEDLRQEIPGLKLVIAPRHTERAGAVEALLEAASPQGVLRWSRLREAEKAAVSGSQARAPAAAPRPAPPVLLVDAVGELDRFYHLADVVFVGGSLVPRGGHNLLEPARLGRPVLFGPSVQNFEDIARHLLSRRAAIQVGDAGELCREAGRLLRDAGLRAEIGERARQAAGALAGATVRHLDWIARQLGGPGPETPILGAGPPLPPALSSAAVEAGGSPGSAAATFTL